MDWGDQSVPPLSEGLALESKFLGREQSPEYSATRAQEDCCCA